MPASPRSGLGLLCPLNVLLLTCGALSLSGSVRPPGTADKALLQAQDFLSHFLATMNLTEPQRPKRPQHRALSDTQTPDYMLQLYRRYAEGSAATAVPSASIVRSFQNKDSSPSRATARGATVHPLLFNVSLQHRERLTAAELRLFTLVRGTRRPRAGVSCKVTVYRVREAGARGREGGRRRRRRWDKAEVSRMEELEEVVTQHIRARDSGWVSFDLTHVLPLWLKSGSATHRLEVHIAGPGSAEVEVERRTRAERNGVMVLFSDDRSGERELGQDHEFPSQPPLPLPPPISNHEEAAAVAVALPRPRRSVKTEPCKRTPLYVDFRDISWDSWIIQPLGYEAYECNGVCDPPMTAEVSPTKHAIVQSLLNVRNPERASRACCVPTKLEPISLLYHENGVVTFKHKYEGMVVAECGCR